MVSGDEARLRQVAGNLLANARIHTPEGTGVHVRVRAHDGQAILEVADEGPGLPPGEEGLRLRALLPGRHRPGPHRPAPAPGGGTGLGLSIVAAIVAAHGGTVHAGSPPSGRGAYFLVALPVAPPPPTAPPPAAEDVSAAPAGSKTPPADVLPPETWAPPSEPPPDDTWAPPPAAQ